ncbi:hypothetical protein NP233_g1066 [Leucocoprinus birnbaumii]|uniref:Uncharacterized protein n=1 Tax=Leucocoprinus birnbaumii TaxID=56174 RepID=A0AAD5W176_9AGAR|nr:hypothetical protein NP233_g1066 [Leucocoprinus birnbaumii]
MSTPESAKRNTVGSNGGATSTGGNGVTAASAAGVSSSVPVSATGYTRSASTGPRMHDYSIPVNSTSTHIRPGLLGVPTTNNIPVTTNSTQAQPMSVPITTSHSWSSVSVSQQSSSHINGLESSLSVGTGTGAGGWSLPRSSVRSVSGSSLRSRSGSASDDEQDGEDAGDDEDSIVDEEVGSYGRRFGGRRNGYGLGAYSHHRTQPKMWKREDEDINMGAWSLREEDEYKKDESGGGGTAKEWDGEMEMDMEM